ncbi:MAG: hypothetical protein J6X55_02105 [Victivallales bacterium]|nr:hypothetical protein [Victivallales bacterium]
MTKEEFNKAVQKLQQDYVPAVKGECVALGYDKFELTCSEEQLATATNVRVDFGGYPAQWIDLLRRFPKLKSMLFNDCYHQPDNGSGWEGLSKLRSLESLMIRYCTTLTQDALDEISCLSNLSILRIIAERMDDGLDYSVLGKLKNLRYLELEANIWAEDLAFAQHLPNLEVLLLDGNAHLDLSRFEVPQSVKFIEVPSYAVKELRESVGDRCHVVSGSRCYGKDKYRFMRPEERKKQEEEVKRLASLKRRIANIKSEMDKLMSEPLLPELGKARIAEMNAHLLEFEKDL